MASLRERGGPGDQDRAPHPQLPGPGRHVLTPTPRAWGPHSVPEQPLVLGSDREGKSPSRASNHFLEAQPHRGHSQACPDLHSLSKSPLDLKRREKQ